MDNRKTSEMRFSISGIDPENEQDVNRLRLFQEMLLRSPEDAAKEAIFNSFAATKDVRSSDSPLAQTEEKPKLSRDDFLQIYPRRPKAPIEYIHKDIEVGLYFTSKRKKNVWKKVSDCEISNIGRMKPLYEIFDVPGANWGMVFVRADRDDAKVWKAVGSRYLITDLEGQINLDL